MSDGRGSWGICPGTSRRDGSCESRAFFGAGHTGGLLSNYAAGGQHPPYTPPMQLGEAASLPRSSQALLFIPEAYQSSVSVGSFHTGHERAMGEGKRGSDLFSPSAHGISSDPVAQA